jgi:hypothetical protein
MKNIHILQTTQPSRLVKNLKGVFSLMNESLEVGGAICNINIYITSDEEIKEGDWYFDGTDLVHKKTKYNDSLVDGNKQAKKIILTTDPTLIADGVQAIGDEFLEWFVKNSSCEFINLEKEELKSIYNPNYKDFTTEGNGIYLTPKDTPLQTNETLIEDNIISYKIIIPQEEPKQEILPEFKLSKDIFNKLSCLSSKELPQEFSKLINENFNELISEEPINLHKMEKKEITAIEFLIEKLKLESIDLSKWHQNLINEAKEIEKQQIVSAFEKGYGNGIDINYDNERIYQGSKYFQKTFKS